MRNRLKKVGDLVQTYYAFGFNAADRGMSLDDCPYSMGEPLKFCAWRGGWWDYTNTAKEQENDVIRFNRAA